MGAFERIARGSTQFGKKDSGCDLAELTKADTAKCRISHCQFRPKQLSNARLPRLTAHAETAMGRARSMVREINKFLGALFACLLMVVVFHLVSGYIFTTPTPVMAGYVLPADGAAPVAAAKAEPEVPLSQLLASASADKGKSIAKQCASCHTFDKGGKNGVGPNLWGIIGRKAASHEGFAYSDAVKSKSDNWTYDDVAHMMEAPAKYMKGTKMTFAGLKSAKDRADVLAYLRTLSDNPAPLPAAK